MLIGHSIAGMWTGEDLRQGNKWGISRRDTQTECTYVGSRVSKCN